MQAHILRNTAVGDVWGVGKRIAKKLAELGIVTASQLSKMPPRMAREQFNVVLERTVLELQGIPCIDLELQPPPKQQIACTRSFGKPITHQQDLVEAVSEFASRAGEKLRKDQQHAAQLYVFAHTSPHREGPRFYRGATLALNPPTADTARLINAAVSGIQQIYEPGFLLAKAGIILQDLCPASLHQGDLLFDSPDDAPDRSQLMQTIDSLNTRYGKGTVHIAGTGMAERAPGEWRMKQARRTPNYTTNLDEVPICRC